MKITEQVFVEELASFMRRNELVECESHFNGDDEARADIELCLRVERWPTDFPKWLFVEAKSHHSRDSPSTINKIFGQLLKETGKSRSDRSNKDYALAIAFPSEAGEWIDSKKYTVTRPVGEAYYRQGFRRIDRTIYESFGELVKARYVLSFSYTEASLRIFDWAGFLAGAEPLLIHRQGKR